MPLQPPDHLTDEQVTYWKELVNRVYAAVEATDTPSDPTMEQIEAMAERAVAEDPDVGFDELPDGWDASTVAEVWTKVGGSFTACKTKFVTEEGWSPNKADRFCAALKDEVRNSEEWREGGGLQALAANEHTFMFPGTLREAAQHVRDTTQRNVGIPGVTVEMTKREDGSFAILVREGEGKIRRSITVSKGDVENEFVVKGSKNMVQNKVGVAELVDDEAMDFLKGVLDKVTDSNTPERRRNLWKAFLNRVVLRKISAAAEWNPALHPRDPETGQFVERPFSVPDDIRSMDTPDIVRELAASDPEFSDKVEGLDIDMDEDLQALVDEAGGPPEPELTDIDTPVEQGGPREIPADATAEDIADSIPTITERFGDELSGLEEQGVPDAKLDPEMFDRATDLMGKNLVRFKDDELKTHVAGRISHVDGPGDRGVNSHATKMEFPWLDTPDEQTAEFSAISHADNAATTTVHHELQHASDTAMGYEYGGEQSGSNGGFHDYDTANPTEPSTETGKAAVDAMFKVRGTDQPIGLSGFAEDARSEVRLDDDGNPEELDSDVIEQRLTADLPDDPAEAYRRYIREVNRAWFKSQEAHRKGGPEAARQMVKMDYQMTNAGEFSAVFAETMNQENPSSFAIRDYIRNHPGLVAAWLNMRDVPDETREEIEKQASIAGVQL